MIILILLNILLINNINNNSVKLLDLLNKEK